MNMNERMYITLQRHSVTCDHYRIFAFFVKRLSCLTHLSEILEAWTRLLDEEIDVIYQNYCKPLM